MNISHLNLSLLTTTAITALKNAYEECSDGKAKESVFTAIKAIIQLHQDLGKYVGPGSTSENDSDCDPSEYCAAV
ncbi:MAG: hypothetical protein HGB32_10155 [Geobacteraceae bacterium]|nr:hypothetical protein [Geobacteraceae bacterium]NTW80497.1 hypothetical protein [Geobacteraceae bacterium]